MMASRGMGDISPSKIPKVKRQRRREDADCDVYAAGGKVHKKKHRQRQNERSLLGW